MPLAAGSRFGPYELLGPLGAGGMGEVYRARDTALDREIALKVLPDSLASDASARARLIREARTAATLNHPNICTIHEVGEAGGAVYLAMELVPGRPLSELIPAGGLPAETVLRYGIQIADALAHAHARGVIHRDLKASNVVVSPDGRAKVLDFGLARRTLAGAETPDPSAEFTLTATGSIVGTPHYLAPEVLRGDRGDERSDIWALGVLLYEMCAGSMPFSGRTGFELSAAILGHPAVPLPARVPPGLSALVQRCLAKDPSQRPRSPGEVRAALEIIQNAAAPAAGSRAPAARWAMRAGLALLFVAVPVVAAWLAWQQPWREKELLQRQLTSNPAENPAEYGAISPDGKTLAMVDRSGLTLRAIDSGENNLLKIPAGFALGGYPFRMVNWFPDGGHLLLSGAEADGTPYLWALPVFGGRARKIVVGGSWATISRDGSHIAYMRDGKAGPEIWCADPNGENPRRVSASDSSGTINTWATWSPNGRRLVYSRLSEASGSFKLSLESCDLDGHRRAAFSSTRDQKLHFFTISTWLADGRLLFGISDPPPSQGDQNLWSLHVDPRSGRPSGKLRRITQWQRLSLVTPTGVSADGKRLAVGILEYQSDCYVGSLAGSGLPLRDIKRITLDDRFDQEPSWMPDGKAILFASNRNGSMDIFRQALDAPDAEPLVTGPGNQMSPRVTADGAWILYTDGEAGLTGGAQAEMKRIMRLSASGGPPEKVLEVQAIASFCCGRRPGAPCVLSELDRSQMVFTAFDPLKGRGRELARIPAGEMQPWDLSPDGSSIAVVEQQDSLPHIRVVSTRGGATRDVRLDRKFPIFDIEWAADGARWFVVGHQPGAGWSLLQVQPGGATTDMIPQQQWMYSSAPSPDGRKIVYTSNTVQENYWLLENF